MNQNQSFELSVECCFGLGKKQNIPFEYFFLFFYFISIPFEYLIMLKFLPPFFLNPKFLDYFSQVWKAKIFFQKI